MESAATGDVHDDVASAGATPTDTTWSRIASDLRTDDVVDDVTVTDNVTVTDDVTVTEQELDSDHALNGIGLPAFLEVSPIVHVVAVSVFTVMSLAGNSLVIYINQRKTEKFRGNIYVILIAAVDIFACCTVLQLYPFIGYLVARPKLAIWGQLFFLLQNTVNMTYFVILGIMALERFLAVFWPFTFREMLNKLYCVGLGTYIACMLLTISVTFNVTPFEQTTLFNIFYFLVLIWILLTCTLYTAIAVKLYRASKQITKYQVGNRSLSIEQSVTSSTHKHDVSVTPSQGLNSMSREVAALKLAAAILALCSSM